MVRSEARRPLLNRIGKAILSINISILALHDELSYDTQKQGDEEGYMRISKGEQTTALQEDALASAHCEKTFRDVMSGAKIELICFHIGTRSLSISREAMARVKQLKENVVL